MRKKVICLVSAVSLALSISSTAAINSATSASYSPNRYNDLKLLLTNKSIYDISDIEGEINQQNYNLLESQKSDYIKQQAEINKQLCLINYQQNSINADETVSRFKNGQQKVLNEYKLFCLYYDTVLLFEQLDLYDANLQYVENQLVIEEEKLSLGLTTENSVLLLRQKIKECENEVLYLNSLIEFSKDEIKYLLENDDVGIEGISFELNQEDYINIINNEKPKLSDIKDQFLSLNYYLKRNTLAIENIKTYLTELDNYIDKTDTTYILAELDLKKNELQLESDIKNYRISIDSLYEDYEYKMEKARQMINLETVLNENINIIYETYSAGEISYNTYLSEFVTYKNQILEIKKSIIEMMKSNENLMIVSKGAFLTN